MLSLENGIELVKYREFFSFLEKIAQANLTKDNAVEEIDRVLTQWYVRAYTKSDKE